MKEGVEKAWSDWAWLSFGIDWIGVMGRDPGARLTK